ncbi:MAG: DUF2341 domain-containing protein, partial [Chitinispirillaceae bacterium]|nr:DUF2341 domain-containing protein [Chitinispirillaceae bacterium]
MSVVIANKANRSSGAGAASLCAFLVFISTVPVSALNKMYWGSITTPSNFWVRNMPVDTFGDTYSRQFFMSWKMDTANGINDGEVHRFKTSYRSPNLFVDTSMSNNLLPSGSLYGTMGYIQFFNNNLPLYSNQNVKNQLDYAIPESSATRVILRLNGRRLQNSAASCSLMTQWTIYPTGQIFRYDSIFGHATPIDSIKYRFNQIYDPSIVDFSNKTKARGGVGAGTSIQNMVVSFLTLRDAYGPVANAFTSPGDTVMVEQITAISTGALFRDTTSLLAANKPHEMAFYMDIQREQLNSLLADTIANSVQYIESLTMMTGTAVTTSMGDLNNDGFNEREGAYIIQASSNTVHFLLPAHGDTCRVSPAFRITNYTAGTVPLYVAVDSIDRTKDLDYNAWVNSSANELVLQFEGMFRYTTDIYISATTPLEEYSSWSYHTDFYLNTKPYGLVGDVYNFPVLLRLNPGSFGGFVNTLASGADIRFAKSNGRHLHYEIERWVDVTGNKDTAEIWVRVDTVKANDSLQHIRMYYGKVGAANRSNPRAVFDTTTGFRGVWHLNEIPGAAGSVMDRTAAGLDADPYGGMSSGNQVAGIAGTGIYFDGTDDYLHLSSPATPLRFSDNFTVSAWVNASALGGSFRSIFSRQYGISASESWLLSVNSSAQARFNAGTNIASTPALSTGQWYHISGVKSGSSITLYVNGVLEGSSGSASTPVMNDNNEVLIGAKNIGDPTITELFSGVIDEVIASNVSRSADWIKLCYENQRENQTLVDIPAGTLTWTGGSNNQWSNPANWSPTRIPKNDDTVMFNTGSVACSLNIVDTVASIIFTSGYTGDFYYAGNTLSVRNNADFRSGGALITDVGTLQFIGTAAQNFIPKAGGYTANQIRQNGSGGTTVSNNGFQCVNLMIQNGLLHLGSGLTDSVASSLSISGSGGIDFGSSVMKVAVTTVNFNVAGTLAAGTGTLEFCRSAGISQTFTPKAATIHPAINHTGSDTLRLATNPLRAQSFLQSAGVLDLNGIDIDTVVGDLTVTNGTMSTIANLAGRTVEVGGNVALSGQSGNLLNLAPGTGWILKAGGTLTVSFAAIGNCTATGSAGTATNSYDLGGNSNWSSIAGNPRIEPGAANLTIGGGFFTDSDSIPLMHLRALSSQAEGVYIDTIRAKMTKGDVGTINYMRLFADIDRDGSFNPPTDTWLKDTTVTVSDSSICFARGAGQHLDSLDVQDTSDYWLVMDLNDATLSSTDTFMFSAAPPQSHFMGRSSYYMINGDGGLFQGDTAWGMQGSLTLDVGDSNGVIGKPVITDIDSIPCMHFSLSASPVEKVYLDTVRVRMTKGNRLAIEKLSFFRDDGTNGVFDIGTDALIKDATVNTDSVATFWQIGGFDSVAASETRRYWMLLHLNSTSIGTSDSFQFSLNADSMVIHGASSNAGFPVGGGTILGDMVPGDEVPYVTEVNASTVSGSYGIGATISVTVTFSENVTVAGGTPVITLETGTTDRDATYASGSGTTTLTFEYTVMAGDASGDLDYVSNSALALSGATIRDANSFNANLTLPTPGTTGSLADTKDIRIDGSAPTVPSTSISAPNGGEVWLAGSSQNITWNNASVTDDLLKNNPISLYYSTDGGSTFPNLIVSGLSNSGSYSWTVADVGTGSARVLLTVIDSAGNTSYDSSDADFMIDNSAPGVASSALTSPNGGEVWAAGASQSITWNTGDISDVMLKNNPISLYYSTDNGSTFSNLIASNLSNSGSYSWTVPSENSTAIRVQITVTDSVDNTSYDTSNGSFTIDNAAPAVASTALSSPDGGEVWAGGSSQSITWNTGDISDVLLKNNPISLYYSTDGGATFPNLIESELANTGTYSWTVASENSSSIRIQLKVTDSIGNVSYDTSSTTFTIDNTAPTVASTCLSSPNGGEVWAAGASQSITWNTADISDVLLRNNPISLYYSTDN